MLGLKLSGGVLKRTAAELNVELFLDFASRKQAALIIFSFIALHWLLIIKRLEMC